MHRLVLKAISVGTFRVFGVFREITYLCNTGTHWGSRVCVVIGEMARFGCQRSSGQISECLLGQPLFLISAPGVTPVREEVCPFRTFLFSVASGLGVVVVVGVIFSYCI